MGAAAATASHPRQSSSTVELAEQIYARHRRHLLGIAKRNSANAEDAEEAEEALQDAFIFFMGHYRPGDEAPPLAWLTVTLKHRCWAIYRRQRAAAAAGRRAASDLVPDPLRLPEEAAEAAELVAVRRRRLALLKPAERRALGLLALGFSYREIVAITGWTYSKVNRCLSEGRARLRKVLSVQE